MARSWPSIHDFGVSVLASKRFAKRRKGRYLTASAYEARTKENRTVANRRERHLAKQQLKV
jgi:hypothetical protein